MGSFGSSWPVWSSVGTAPAVGNPSVRGGERRGREAKEKDSAVVIPWALRPECYEFKFCIKCATFGSVTLMRQY